VVAQTLLRDQRAHDWVGFQVRSAEGHLGFVESVQYGPETREPRFVAVRAGRIIVLLVPVEEVESVLPGQRTLVLGRNTGRLVPEYLGNELVLRPAKAAVPLARAV
jgi:hypothetical protein